MQLSEPRAWRVEAGKFMCLACGDGRQRDLRSALRHEKLEDHITATAFYLDPPASGSNCAAFESSSHSAVPPGPLATVLLSLTSGITISSAPPLPGSISDVQEPFLDLDALGDGRQLDFEPAGYESVVSASAVSLEDWLADRQPSDDSSDNASQSSGDGYLEDFDPQVALGSQHARYSKIFEKENPNWFPWPDKETCVLDILRHLPGSMFSQTQTETILWTIRSLGINNVPTIDAMKFFEAEIQQRCGIRSLRFEGKLGHLYYVNELAGIIAQEMANPLVRPHLHFYPEDSFPKLEECWQADRWLKELDPALATPMIRIGNRDFYVFEPSKTTDGQIVIPERWFTKLEHGHHMFYTRVYDTIPISQNGYLVHDDHFRIIAASELLLNFTQLINTCHSDGLPDPRRILGLVGANGRDIRPWTQTDPYVGNQWRQKANGRRVVSFMMWLYCDDTSGNVSKKWNKHNSFLFTAAGLPSSLVHKASNIHFLSTSNIAPPLEMLDGIVEQLEYYQGEGIWAWDIVYNELVLVIPAILALLGDNPMQSELACHVGLKGRFFCRVCWVYGAEPRAKDDHASTVNANRAQAAGAPQRDDNSDDGITSDQSERDASPVGNINANPQKKGRHEETFQEMVDRTHRFLETSRARTKAESYRCLQVMFHDVCASSGQTKYKNAKTASGLKDNFLDFFTEKVFQYSQKLRGTKESKIERVKQMVTAEMPNNPYSPVWRIRGLDPHQDTPVEVLHTVLLGFVKYFWRDAIARVDTNHQAMLITRLDSFDVRGLGLSPLSGERLVIYAGSLTGSDFRIVSQVAPFVLYDLLPPEAYDAWLALSAMVPLIWQPRITNIEVHLTVLQTAVDYFLTTTARFTPRWFNKPKFHVLQHLVGHIRRFGPAILFATENFESFNSTIRDHSVHSNRQAPSRDIAKGMAQFSRIRHLFAGGRFVINPVLNLKDNESQPDENFRHRPPLPDDQGQWRTAGSLAAALVSPYVSQKNIISDYMGLAGNGLPPDPGTCRLNLFRSSRPWPSSLSPPTNVSRAQQVNEFRFVTAINHDECSLDDFILVKGAGAPLAKPSIGKIISILQFAIPEAMPNDRADYILLEEYSVTGSDNCYKMPRLLKGGPLIIPAVNILCAINIQHNCFANQCRAMGTHTIYQERERTSRTKPIIRHNQPDDVLLNTGQMRDAIWVQQFVIPPPIPDRTTAILLGSQAEIDSRKAQNNQGKGKGKGRKRRSSIPDDTPHALRQRLLPATPIPGQLQHSISPLASGFVTQLRGPM